ncbi:uncharacterized protein LOC117177979 [Belonocnema kinseyi]|uniref:uncharacterized protein LOC117177979 n=1 Tax=Belonocnema kinseyi TaxID=2817044 RepID=UPI00143DED5C|nr:uncharacterized protein LOC117177979 [Belonocnema kinseyi]
MPKFFQIFIILTLLYFLRGKTRSLHHRIKRLEDLFHDILADDLYTETISSREEPENGRENINKEGKQSKLKSKDVRKENSANSGGTLVIEGLEKFKYYPKVKPKIDYPYFNSARKDILSRSWNSSKETTSGSIVDTQDTEPNCIEITSSRPRMSSTQKPMTTHSPITGTLCDCLVTGSEFIDMRPEDCPEIMRNILFKSVEDGMDCKSIIKQLGLRYVQFLRPFPPIVNIYAPPMVNMFSPPILPRPMTLPISYLKYPRRRQAAQEKYHNNVKNNNDLKHSSSL